MKRMACLAAMLSLTLMAHAAAPKQSEAGERDADKAVRFTDALEKNPFAADAADMRKWLIEWLVETPDYLVTVCDILGEDPDQDRKYGAELLSQQLFGNVRFQIRHPEKTDELSFQLAGVESVLVVYRAMLAKDPAARIEYFDQLVELQNKGGLREHMEPIITDKCSERDERQQVAALRETGSGQARSPNNITMLSR